MDNLEQKPQVVALSGPQLPADHGLSSLGLLMQLGGSLYAGLMSVMALTFLFTLGMARGGGGGGQLWSLFLVLSLCVVRSAMHRIAGSALVYGHPGGAFKPTRNYIWFALGQTFVTLVLLKGQMKLPTEVIAEFGAMLLAWPLTLLIFISSPRIKQLVAGPSSYGEIPMAEDKGFEGASVLMVLFGTLGTLITGFMLYMMLKLPGALMASGIGMLVLGTIVLLFIRSIFHFLAGRRGVSGASADEAIDVTQRYYNFGVITSWITGGVFLLIMMMSGISGIGFIWVSMFVFLLLSWPLIIRRFFAERQFADMLAGDAAPLHRRAPDLGLTALGWLLVSIGGISLAQSLAGVLAPASGFDLRGMGGMDEMLSSLMLFGAKTLGHSPWWAVGLGALQLWAGIELVRMTERHKLVGVIYGVVSSLVAFYIFYPMIKDLGGALSAMGGGGGALDGLAGGVTFIGLALQLAIPIGTIILVNRRPGEQVHARVRVVEPPAGPAA